MLEARIAAERIPNWTELEKTVAEQGRDALHGGDLFDGEVFLRGTWAGNVKSARLTF